MRRIITTETRMSIKEFNREYADYPKLAIKQVTIFYTWSVPNRADRVITHKGYIYTIDNFNSMFQEYFPNETVSFKARQLKMPTGGHDDIDYVSVTSVTEPDR